MFIRREKKQLSSDSIAWKKTMRQIFFHTDSKTLDIMINVYFEAFDEELLEEFYDGTISHYEYWYLQGYLETCYEMAIENLEKEGYKGL